MSQLTFVGIGFREGQITLEGLVALKVATKIYYFHESSGPQWLKKLCPDAQDIFSVTAGNSNDRRHRYENTVGFLLSQARAGHTVVCAFYGSAAFFACIAHTAAQRAGEQGISVAILGGISTFEALTCDLACHPVAGKAVSGRAITVAMAAEYLQSPARFSQSVPLVLLMVGHVNAPGDAEDRAGLRFLAEVLGRMYNEYHECVLYHCTAEGPPVIRTVPICRIPEVRVNPEGWSAVTLLIPPAEPNPVTQRRAIQRAFNAGANYARIEQHIQQRQEERAASNPQLTGDFEARPQGLIPKSTNSEYNNDKW